MFSSQRVAQIDNLSNISRETMQEFEVFREKLETAASKNQLNDIDAKFKLYAPIEFMKEIKSD